MRIVDHAGIEVLEERVCRTLLATAEIGRLAVSIGGSPEIFPVNFDFDDGVVVIRSQAGTKVDAARGRRACLEIDSFDTAARTGWSVVAKGRLDEVEPLESKAWRRASSHQPDPWAGGDRPHVLCLHVERLTGRCVGPAPSI